MKVVTNCIFSIMMVLLLNSCKEEKVEAASDARFRLYNLENRGWKSRVYAQKTGGINFTATEVPIQYYILKELGTDNLDKVDSIYEENKRERIIEFTFQGDKGQDLLNEEFSNMDYQSAVKYISFTIENDFYAIAGKDTINCSGVMFERNFKVASFNKIMLFFTDINPNEEIQLVYNDNLFRKGILKFKFKDAILNL
ncbi:hypothetical protein [Flavobacterium sp. 3HN19-14]|uniref:hypothetical protein n=1 Tax=Flavobacterium sp. 3HN19-14 TaxID=3448133 RepID=UPI003EE12388